MEEKKKCAICNAEGALAVFGILAGLVIVLMSVDVIRRIRIEGATEEPAEVSEDE